MNIKIRSQVQFFIFLDLPFFSDKYIIYLVAAARTAPVHVDFCGDELFLPQLRDILF